ncbi:cold-shock protein [Halorutilales archaeon Cl-col2-1]
MQHGWVRFLSKREAYGFIKRKEYGQDVFVHRADVKKGNLSRGARVEFKVTSTGRGPRARKVNVIEEGEFKTNK